MSGSEIAVVAGVGFGSALLGALAGGLTTSLLEMWKQVLGGIDAARVIRYEMFINSSNLEMLMEGKIPGTTLTDDAWRAHRLALAPLLSESEMFYLCREQGFLPVAQQMVGQLSNPMNVGAARKNLQDWISSLKQRTYELAQLECRSRTQLFLKALRGRRFAALGELARTFEVAK